jgi:hypothetical protein
MGRRWSFVTAPRWRLWQFDPSPLAPEDGSLFPPSSGVVLNTAPPLFSAEMMRMYSGTLIDDLFAVVERAQNSAKPPLTPSAESRVPRPEPQAAVCHCTRESSESEQFPQPLGLSPADWNLALLLVVHTQLIRALEPGNDFADAVDVHQVGAVRPPEKIRV